MNNKLKKFNVKMSKLEENIKKLQQLLKETEAEKENLKNNLQV